jgi:virulence-associated protein VagC
MAKTDIAKLFQNGRSQAVRLPREFRFEGDRVRIRRVAEGVLLLNYEPFPVRRRQPTAPRREVFK